VRVIQGIKSLSFVNFAIAFLIIRFVSIANGFPARVDSDSGSYTSGDGFTNWNWVSLSGAEHGRGWPTILIFSLVNSDSGRIFILQILSLISWVFFGFVGGKYVNPNTRTYLYLSLLLFGNSTAGQFWNNWIGRESIAFSLTLFALSLQIYWILSPTPTSKLVFFISFLASLYVITKPSLIFIGLVQIIFLLVRLNKHASNWPRKSASILFLFIVSIYTFVNIGNQDKGWGNADPTGRTTKEIAYAYLISDFNANEKELRNYFALNGAPICATVKQPSTDNNLGGPMEYAAELHSNCEGYSQWIKKSFYNRYFLYSITHLKSTLELTISQIPFAFAFPNDSYNYQIMQFIEEKIINLITIVALLYLIYFVFLNFNRFRNQFILRFLCALTIAFGASILFSLLIQPTHASDISRQNYVSSFMMRIIIVTAALFVKSNAVYKGVKNFKIN